ncbi:inverse autotransporter beta domain-containing protein [Acaryochloris marina]|uniref:Inverse autotransporter beta-domain domain-containing protein n=1 Tax=Acaryochloris marina (strain MBIC 11017) TaxID=329726 RepID=B0C654_ACAM1|nr:inverse autotransporter beta-barrel domain-containing protein [Acaryochloris marina]ABW31171.1 hypothetical protein AM1_6239 [Acaryochloris marina MBIC11017]
MMARRTFANANFFLGVGQTIVLSLLISGIWPLTAIAEQIDLASSPSEQPLTASLPKLEATPAPITVHVTPLGDLDLTLTPTPRFLLKTSHLQPEMTLPTVEPQNNRSVLEPSTPDLLHPPRTLTEAGWTSIDQTISTSPETPSSLPSPKVTSLPLTQAESGLPQSDPSKNTPISQEEAKTSTPPAENLGIPYFVDAEFRGSTRRQFGVLNLRLPFFQDEKSFAFADVHFEAGSNETFMGNLGLAYRRVLNTSEENPWILGTHAFYDTKRSENDFQYHQGSLGVELISKKFEFRVNGYLPGSNSNVVGQRTVNGVLGIEPRANGLGTNIVQQIFTLEARERALAGFDFEAGHRHHFSDKVSLGLFGGYFFFDSSETLSIDGPMARAQLEVQDPLGMNGGLLQVGSRFRFDETRGSELEGFVRLGIPFGGPQRSEPLSLTQRLARRPIERHYEITTFAQDINRPISLTELQAAVAGQGTLSPLGPQTAAITSQVVLNPATGQPINIFFVNGDGTAGDGTQDNPLTVAQATSSITQANDVLFFLDDAGTIDTQTGLGNSLTLKTGQQALGVGTTPNFVFTVPNLGSVTVLDMGQPQLVNGANNNVLTLANNNTIDGLAFNGQNTAPRGIAAVTGATNTTIRNSSLGNFTVAGIQITPSTNTTIDNVVFNNNATDVIVNATNTTLTNVVSTNATGPAIQILNATGTTTLTNVDISNSGGDSLQFANPAGTITATNVDITNAGDNGLEITDGDGTFTFDATSSITNATNAAFNVVGGTSTITYNGTITQTNPASAINITDKTGGTTTFNGFVTANTSTAPGVNLTNNTGSTVAFNGGLDIDTTTGIGFNATNGGIVNVAATNGGTITTTGNQAGILLQNNTESINLSGLTVDSTDGPALQATNIANATVTDSTLTSTNSATNGITLNDISGVFDLSNTTVNITNPAAVGINISNVDPTMGTVRIIGLPGSSINDTGGDGVVLGNNTTVAGMNISPLAGNRGIFANNVQNVAVQDNQIVVSGDDTGGIRLQNVSGSAEIINNQIATSGNTTNTTESSAEFLTDGAHGIEIDLEDVTLTSATIAGNIITTSGTDAQGILATVLSETGAAKLGTATISGNTISTVGDGSDGIQLTVPIRGSFSNTTITAGSIDNITVAGNDISTQGNSADGINIESSIRTEFVNTTINSTLNGGRIGSVRVAGNDISTQGDFAQGINVRTSRGGTFSNTISTSGRIDSATISGNTISTQGEFADGINVSIRPDSSLGSAMISGNTVSTQEDSADGINMRVDDDSSLGSATISDNTLSTQGDFADGINVSIDDDSSLDSTTISGNIISTQGDFADGINVRVDDDSSLGSATISDNTLSTQGEDADGINVRIDDDSSLDSTTISDNTISQAGQNSVQIDNNGGNPICTTISGNLSSNPNFAGLGGNDFNLNSRSNTFQVVNLATVSTDNNNATFSFDGTLVPPGTPLAPFTNVASCP